MGHITAELTKGWMMEGIGMQVILRILLSLALAAIIGCERSSKRHSAGMRTLCWSVYLLQQPCSQICICPVNFLWDPCYFRSGRCGHCHVKRQFHSFQFKNQIKGLGPQDLYGTSLWDFPVPICRALFKDRSNHFEVHLELKSSFKLQDFVATIRKLGIRIDDIEANPAYLNSGLSVYTVSLTVDSQELKKKNTVTSLKHCALLHLLYRRNQIKTICLLPKAGKVLYN